MPRASVQETQPRLPVRDWFLVPLLALATMAFFSIGIELTARRLFHETQKTLASCMVLNDPSTGPRGIPNTVCQEKNAEAKWIETRFDACGYRNDIPCGGRHSNAFRIVMTGSSVGLGERVQREESLAAFLPADLSAITGRNVELYNESMGFQFARNADLRFDQVLKEQPDLILWTLTPNDVESAAFTLPAQSVGQWNQQGLAQKAWQRILTNLTAQPLSVALSQILGRTRTALMLRHFLYQSQSEYLKAYLTASDDDQGFLKSDQSPLWHQHLHQFETYAADMESRAKAARIPFVATLVPSRAQTAMISSASAPAGYNPYKLDQQLSQIITRHGGIYIDLSRDFERISNPERLYLPVDGHPNPAGHALLAHLLADKLTDGQIPALSAAHFPATTEQKR